MQTGFFEKKNSLTTSEVAEQVAIPLEVYHHYEEGKACPNLVELLFIADFYDVSVDYLIGRTENPE